MKKLILSCCSMMMLFASSIFAQGYSRESTLVGTLGDHGRCTVEVIVDDIAQVEISGTVGTLRTVSGRPAQWRRFECNSVLPSYPVNFRFSGVDGRGRQTLIRDPRNSGVAMVEIEDRENGAEGYTFDLLWDTRASERTYQSESTPSPYYEGSYRATNTVSGVSEAIRLCQTAVSSEASRRFRTNDISFFRTAIDDGVSRQDYITGTLNVRTPLRDERYGFTCAVDLGTGQLRTANLDINPMPVAFR